MPDFYYIVDGLVEFVNNVFVVCLKTDESFLGRQFGVVLVVFDHNATWVVSYDAHDLF